MNFVTKRATRSWLRAQQEFDRRLTAAMRDSERGDVPGWVLVLLMTAGLVTVLWAVAGPKLTALLSSALDSVSGR